MFGGFQSETLVRRLAKIEEMASKILDKPITPPLSAEEGVVSAHLNDLVRGRTNLLWANEPYRSVELDLNLALEDAATVRLSQEWFRRALDILIDNAVEATADLPVRHLTIATRHAGEQVEVVVSDNGKGIPPEIRNRILREPIPKTKGAKGLGLGLLFAQNIVQAYGGEIRFDPTAPSGTTMIVTLPMET